MDIKLKGVLNILLKLKKSYKKILFILSILLLGFFYTIFFIKLFDTNYKAVIHSSIFLVFTMLIIFLIIILRNEVTKYINKLQRSEKKYKALFESTKEAIFIHSIDDEGNLTKFKDINKIGCKMLGVNKENLLKKTLYDLIPEDDYKYFTKDNCSFETTINSMNGNFIPVEISNYYFEIDNKKMIQTIIRDITQRKKREERLIESEKKHRYLIENLPDGLVIHDGEKILFTNDATAKVLGLKSKDFLIGKSVYDYIKPKYHNIINKRMDMTIKKGGETKPLEEEVIRSDGTTFYGEISGMPIKFDNKKAALVIVRDITDRKQKEKFKRQVKQKEKLLKEIREYDEMKTEFFANISHELKTPLNVILGTIQLFDIYLNNSEIKKDEKIEYRLKIMKQNCYRLLRLVNNLIDITKIDSGYLNLKLESRDIVNLVEEITLSVAEYVENKGIRLIFDTFIEERIILCDPDKIERIILNLLSNAVKFTDEGGLIKVTVYDKKESVTISVKDNGVGIPEEKLLEIFERFRQVDKTLTRNHEGSGIGLSLVKSLVNLHGGDIFIKSESEIGSEFIIDLPAREYTENNNIIEDNKGGSNSLIERINIEFSDIYA
ncbi:MAG: PAS domain S-box protein [Firmicutes bacterium]|nr:PAS domain S-box protein [Bacillota bacterium]